jgi:L-ascorbate metabolism protein UlaG (beta-lactamase superfamily)
VLGPLGHAVDLARYQLTRERRQRDDASALSHLATRPPPLPRGLELEWLGVAGYRLTFEGRTLLIDPYFTRVPFRAVLEGRRLLPDESLHERRLPDPGEIVGIAVGHTHWDHAVDVPALARRFGCQALGSSSLVNLMALHGLAVQAVEVEPHRAYELGPFRVTFVPSRHSKLLLGLAVPMDGELTCDHLDALAPRAYRCGQVWGIHVEVDGTTLYHQGSADLIDEEIRHRDVDVFLAGIAGRSFTPRYWERILGRLRPATVVASHFDDFFRRLDEPLGFATNVDLAGFPDEIAAVSREIAVAALPAPQSRGGAAQA